MKKDLPLFQEEEDLVVGLPGGEHRPVGVDEAMRFLPVRTLSLLGDTHGGFFHGRHGVRSSWVMNSGFRRTISEPKVSAKFSTTFDDTSAIGSVRPSSRAIEVTPLWNMPQGIILSKYERSVLMFSAKPC